MSLLCPDCNNPVETIIACGCKDYFCNSCNQMVSKRRVIDTEAAAEQASQEDDQAEDNSQD